MRATKRGACRNWRLSASLLPNRRERSNRPEPAISPIRPEIDTRSPSRKVFSAAMAASESPGGGDSRDRVEKRSATRARPGQRPVVERVERNLRPISRVTATFWALPSILVRMPRQSVKAPTLSASATLCLAASSICSGLLEASAGLASACSPSRNAFCAGFSSSHGGRSSRPERGWCRRADESHRRDAVMVFRTASLRLAHDLELSDRDDLRAAPE